MIASSRISSIESYRNCEEDMVEIGKICQAFRFVYRCSSVVKEESFRQIGRDLLPLLSSVVKKALSTVISGHTYTSNIVKDTSRRKRDDTSQKYTNEDRSESPSESSDSLSTSDTVEKFASNRGRADAATYVLEGALGALRNLSSAPSAEDLMSKHAGFLDLLLKVVRYDMISTDAKANTLNVIVNLAHCYENKKVMIEHSDVLDMFVACASDSDDLIRNAAACGLQNLTAHDKNILTMVKHVGLLQASINLLHDSNNETREFAAGTLQNLSVAKKNAKFLACFDNGAIVKEVLKVIAKDGYPIPRNRSIWMLGNILCAETLFIINLDGILDVLAIAAAKDSLEDTRVQAALIFKSFIMLLIGKGVKKRGAHAPSQS